MVNRLIRTVSKFLTGGRREVAVTSMGFFTIALLFAIGYAGISTRQNLLILLMGLLLSFLLVNWYLQLATQMRMRIERKIPPYIFAGKPFHVDVTVTNNKFVYPVVSLIVGDNGRNFVLEKEAYFPTVPARRKETQRYEARFTKRGIQKLDSIHHRTRFPFGILHRKHYVKAAREVLVYPEIRSVRTAIPFGAAPGDDPSPRKGSGIDLLGFHEYQPEEDLRLIHWPTSAKAGRPIAREFQEEYRHRVMVVFDNIVPPDTPPGFDDAFEEAVIETASTVSHFLSLGFAVGLATSRDNFPPDLGPAQFHTLMGVLALVEPDRDGEASLPPCAGNRVDVRWKDFSSRTRQGPEKTGKNRKHPFRNPLRR